LGQTTGSISTAAWVQKSTSQTAVAIRDLIQPETEAQTPTAIAKGMTDGVIGLSK